MFQRVEKDAERAELLTMNQKILTSLEKEVDQNLHNTQLGTAKKIFKRFVRLPKTKDAEIQVNLDEMLANIAAVIEQKEGEVGSLTTQVEGIKKQLKHLEEKHNEKLAQYEQLMGSYKQ